MQAKDYSKPMKLFKKFGGTARTAELIRAGMHPRMLYDMLEAGAIEKLSRGLYRLADLPPLGNPDLVAVALRVPNGVLCLISALAFHEITTQIPHEIYLAIGRNSRAPRIDYPPVRVFRFPESSFSEGIERHTVDGVEVKVYSPEKTLADCFKYRNKIGLDTAIEALRRYRQGRRFNSDRILNFARMNRVEKLMRPYLEALL